MIWCSFGFVFFSVCTISFPFNQSVQQCSRCKTAPILGTGGGGRGETAYAHLDAAIGCRFSTGSRAAYLLLAWSVSASACAVMLMQTSSMTHTPARTEDTEVGGAEVAVSIMHFDDVRGAFRQSSAFFFVLAVAHGVHHRVCDDVRQQPDMEPSKFGRNRAGDRDRFFCVLQLVD